MCGSLVGVGIETNHRMPLGVHELFMPQVYSCNMLPTISTTRDHVTMLGLVFQQQSMAVLKIDAPTSLSMSSLLSSLLQYITKFHGNSICLAFSSSQTSGVSNTTRIGNTVLPVRELPETYCGGFHLQKSARQRRLLIPGCGKTGQSARQHSSTTRRSQC